MRDRETSTIWNHLDGKAVQGPLAGERLTIVPLPQKPGASGRLNILIRWSWTRIRPSMTGMALR